MAGRFPLLLDEHVPRSLEQALHQRGWAVVRVVDLKAKLGPGADDEQVFTYASKHGYVVLSSDERALWRPRLHSEHGDPFPGMLCWPQRHRLETASWCARVSVLTKTVVVAKAVR